MPTPRFVIPSTALYPLDDEHRLRIYARVGNRLSVVVEDSRLGENFALQARPDNARDVLTHPDAYAQQPQLAA